METSDPDLTAGIVRPTIPIDQQKGDVYDALRFVCRVCHFIWIVDDMKPDFVQSPYPPCELKLVQKSFEARNLNSKPRSPS
jgi:hypothetical protein